MCVFPLRQGLVHHSCWGWGQNMTLAEVGAGTLLMGDVKVGSLAFAEVGTGTYFLDVFGASIQVMGSVDENGLNLV